MHSIGRWLAVALLLVACGGATAGALEDAVHAVNNDDERTVADLLRRGLDVNTVGPNSESLLMIAARHGRPTMVKTIPDPRPRINARNAFGETALMLAAYQGHTEVVRQLLAQGAEINHEGWTPLMYAAAQNRIDIARILIGQGARINSTGDNGTTAMMMAAREGNLGMVLLLLEHGADPNLRNHDGQTALGLARAQEKREVVELLRRAGAAE